MPFFYSEHTAHKTHKCDACRKPIRPGQRYKRAATPPDSELGNDKWWVIAEHADPPDCTAILPTQISTYSRTPLHTTQNEAQAVEGLPGGSRP